MPTTIPVGRRVPRGFFRIDDLAGIDLVKAALSP
jgi:hypothetical protein